MPVFILYSFGKTRMMGLPDGEKSLTICIVYPFLTECTNVTDRQTDTQTDRRMDTAWRQRPHLVLPSRSKNAFVGPHVQVSLSCMRCRDQIIQLYCSSGHTVYTPDKGMNKQTGIMRDSTAKVGSLMITKDVIDVCTVGGGGNSVYFIIVCQILLTQNTKNITELSHSYSCSGFVY